MKRKLAVILCAAMVFCQTMAGGSLFAASSPTLTAIGEQPGTALDLTLNQVDRQTYAMQLELNVTAADAVYQIEPNPESTYSHVRLEKKESGNGATVFIYLDSTKNPLGNGSISIGTLRANKAFSIAGSAKVILLDRNLNDMQYENVAVNSASDLPEISGGSNGTSVLVKPEDKKEPVQGGTTEQEQPTTTFRDIEGHWAESSIKNVVSKGLMNGMGNGNFAPNEPLTRAMLVTTIFNLEMKLTGAAPTGKDMGFDDVLSEQWYTNQVNWAADHGIVSGIGNGLFDPNAPVTREQMAVMFMNYCKYKGIALSETSEAFAFQDRETISDWAKQAVEEADRAGIIGGKPDGTFDPQGKATRAEIAVVLERFIAAAGIHL